jgi:3-methyladenine DNA glycosylase/8-oxoguanine DNA glycosylase
VRALASTDERLAALMDRVGPFRMQVNSLHSPFSALLEAITYQQLTGKAAETILRRVHALCRPRPIPRPGDILATSPDSLRAAGLSRAKVAAVRDLAEKTLDGTVPTLARLRRMPDDEILNRLTSIRGIGPWTVEMLLIFRLGRGDILPATDYGIRKGFHAAFRTRGLPTSAQVLRRGERWRPYRTVASWYLWRAADTATPGG